MQAVGVERSMSISAGNRQPSGKQRPRFKPRHAGANNIKARYRNNWALMVKHGADPVWATAIGMLHLDGVLTDAEADAAVFYAELAGRYDRFHPNKVNLPRTPRSQAFEFGSKASDTEIERHNIQGTITSYERRARRIRKQWEKAQTAVGTKREMVEKLCLFNEAPAPECFDRLKDALADISKRFGLATGGSVGRDGTMKPHKPVDMKKLISVAVHVISDRFVVDKAVPKTFQLCGAKNEMGIKVFSADAYHQTVMVKLPRGALGEHVAMLFIKACEAQGWTDHKG
jgi:hypothetical protein